MGSIYRKIFTVSASTTRSIHTATGCITITGTRAFVHFDSRPSYSRPSYSRHYKTTRKHFLALVGFAAASVAVRVCSTFVCFDSTQVVPLWLTFEIDATAISATEMIITLYFSFIVFLFYQFATFLFYLPTKQFFKATSHATALITTAFLTRFQVRTSLIFLGLDKNDS